MSNIPNPRLTTRLKDGTAPGRAAPAACGRFELLPLDQLKADPSNPRRHSREQIRAISRSINAFGFNAPILINRNSQIIAGHGRFEAAKLLGCVEVPVVWLEHLTEAQAKAYLLADNKLTDRSSWDDAALAARLKELTELAIDFEVEDIGFELPEIDFRIQSLDAADELDLADEFQPCSGPAVSQCSDLWLLGDHRLYCGSALEASAYDVLLEGAKAAAVFADPPYNVKIDGHVCGSGAIKHQEFAMASGEMTPAEFERFLCEANGLIGAHAEPGAVVFACMDWRHMGEMLAAGRAACFDLINLCVWVKSNGGMGSLYRSRHELMFVFRNGKAKHLNNVQLGRFGRNRTNVWNYAGANSFPRKGRAKGLDLHPTVKPIAMVADALLDSTRPNDVVLDPFCGSGTTILAAERVGRRCYGVEIDPLYADTAIARWERMTGAQAHHASAGLSPTSKPGGERRHESSAKRRRRRIQEPAPSYAMEERPMRQFEAPM
jgi:DNA modification methylase